MKISMWRPLCRGHRKEYRVCQEGVPPCYERGARFFAPHLLYPQLLNDANPHERQTGLDMGIAMLSRCDELWCYGDRISPGMRLEIEEAARLGIPVYRVMEQKNGFAVGKVKYSTPAEAPSLAMGMV